MLASGRGLVSLRRRAASGRVAAPAPTLTGSVAAVTTTLPRLSALTAVRSDDHRSDDVRADPRVAVELLSVLYWGDCQDGKTSHSTRAGYVIDAMTEEIDATAKWYAPGFTSMTPKKGQYMVGHKLPGVSKACELMVEAHRSAMLEQPFLKVCNYAVPCYSVCASNSQFPPCSSSLSSKCVTLNTAFPLLLST